MTTTERRSTRFDLWDYSRCVPAPHTVNGAVILAPDFPCEMRQISHHGYDGSTRPHLPWLFLLVNLLPMACMAFTHPHSHYLPPISLHHHQCPVLLPAPHHRTRLPAPLPALVSCAPITPSPQGRRCPAGVQPPFLLSHLWIPPSLHPLLWNQPCIQVPDGFRARFSAWDGLVPNSLKIYN